MASRSEKYLNAMKDVKDNGMTVRAAAKKWSVPKSSLYDRLSGRVKYYRRSGPPAVLTREEETCLAESLVEMKKRGCTFTKNDIFDHVKKMLHDDKRQTPFINNRPGNKWFRSFLARNNSIKNAMTHEKKHASSSTLDSSERLSSYKTFMQEQCLADSQIWKCIMTSFDLQGKHGKVKGISKKQSSNLSNTKELLTLVSCFNACGQLVPPYVVIPGKKMPKTYNPLEGSTPGSAFSVTKNGIMDASSFYFWLDDHFIPNISSARPVVLHVDSHNSHVDPQVFQLAKKNGIEIFGGVANSDIDEMAKNDFSHTMAETWYKNVQKFNKHNPDMVITKKNFCAVFRSTWDVMQQEIMKNSFHHSGLCPFDALQIPDVSHDNSTSMMECSDALMTMATTEVVAVVEIDSSVSETVTSCLSEQTDHEIF